ncbi:DUF2975 domain-containing protein [Legionella feeleii]|uniref:Protein of uncharacterized function (DUF2975) n=1 Tax=Legionella feeleii TaxID=453 RepID=A0A378IVV8_9GAMM|nr:DUF2975 domain-containing protein [Legionella feeleii]STX39357.1 Protein of uncharacterised function (DUF2975) [Legionella feeleii]
MKKIQLTSHILNLFFRILCWLIPIATVFLSLFHIEDMLNWGAWASIISSTHIQDPSNYSLTHRLVILAIQFLPLSITVLICHKLAKLFGLYEKGDLFEEENIILIRSISIYMILGELVQLIYQPLITVALSFNNPPGERFASITLGTTNVSTLITAFIILVASWILKEANQLKSDSQLTI